MYMSIGFVVMNVSVCISVENSLHFLVFNVGISWFLVLFFVGYNQVSQVSINSLE